MTILLPGAILTCEIDVISLDPTMVSDMYVHSQSFANHGDACRFRIVRMADEETDAIDHVLLSQHGILTSSESSALEALPASIWEPSSDFNNDDVVDHEAFRVWPAVQQLDSNGTGIVYAEYKPQHAQRDEVALYLLYDNCQLQPIWIQAEAQAPSLVIVQDLALNAYG
jgi:hypothetical protein